MFHSQACSASLRSAPSNGLPAATSRPQICASHYKRRSLPCSCASLAAAVHCVFAPHMLHMLPPQQPRHALFAKLPNRKATMVAEPTNQPYRALALRLLLPLVRIEQRRLRKHATLQSVADAVHG